MTSTTAHPAASLATAIGLAGLLLAGSTGCATSGGAGASPADPPEPPEWANSPPTGADASYFVGRVDRAPNAREALEGAEQRALASVAEQFAVQVQGEIEVTEKTDEESGYAYRVERSAETTTVPISLEAFEVVEREARTSGEHHWGWALVEVPNGELARIQRELQGKTALYVDCTPEKRCPSNLRSRIESVASARGMHLVPRPVESPPSTDDLAAIASDYQAAELLEVRFEVVETTRIDREHFARVRLDWKRYDTDDREVVDSRVVGPVKGGHFSTDEAVVDAIDEIVEQLERAK